MTTRPFDEERDVKAIEQIWREVGWITSDESVKALKDMLSVGRCLCGLLDGEVEAVAHSTPGFMHYDGSELPLCAVTGVTVSRVARKQGFAARLTAESLALGAADGAAVASLGMFEQGFYDRVGFGTGSYEHRLHFDPSSLSVSDKPRPPRRLTAKDWKAVHQALVARMRHHGSVTLTPARSVRAQLLFVSDPWGLGYFEGDELTHFVFGSAKGENGPYWIETYAYRNLEQLMELLALIKSLGDQVRSIGMFEPPHIQLQTLINKPFRRQMTTKRSDFELSHESSAWWQLRILDLPACMAARHWGGRPIEFNLTLTDPVSALPDSQWAGIGGEYSITVAEDSSASPGHRDGLPEMRSDVNTFSRLWMGISPASSLAYTGNLNADPELLRELDAAFLLPAAQPTWYY